MNVSSWSIQNPVPSILLFAMLTFLGLEAFKSTGVQHFPDIELPTIIITASWEGAAPTQLETEVVRKIEDQVASLGGVKHIRTTITDGRAMIIVEFDIDKNAEVALGEVRNAVDTIRVQLPQEMNPPVISKVTTGGAPILTFVVQAPPTMDEADLSWFIDNDIAKVMLAVKGVGQFSRVGGVTREIHVDLDPTRMAALGVTSNDISQRLRQIQREASGGRGDLGGGVQSFRILGTVTDANAIAALEISLADGRNVRIDEIAVVRDAIAERSVIALLNNQPVIGFNITRIKGASEVTVAHNVRAVIEKFETEHPQIQIDEAFDTVAEVEDNYEGSMDLLYEGAVLAILVVWWFLRDWRATIISATALPLSIIPTFLVMYWAGFTLNTLTLLAMALVVGILVDDAIVEVENIARHLKMGKTPYVAAMEAADEIGLAVIATTFTLIAVFLPTAFMGGVPGKFFRPFGITAAVAVFASLLVARLLTPMMAAYFMRPHQESNVDTVTMQAYLILARWCLQHRFFTLLSSIAFFIGSLQLLPLLPKGFVPAADRSQAIVSLELQPGSSLEDTRASVEQATKILQTIAEVEQVFAVVGSAPGSGGPIGTGATTDVRKATLTVNLTYRKQRKLTQKAVEQKMRIALQALPGVRVSTAAGSSAGEKLQIILASDNYEALATAAKYVLQDLRTLQGVGNITSDVSLQRPEIHIIPDFNRIADLGITTNTLAETIRVATAGDYEVLLTKLNLPQRQVPIRVRLAQELRHNLTAIQQLLIATRGELVPLASVATIILSAGPSQINRLDRQRQATLNVELANRVIGSVMVEVDKLASLNNLPPSIKRLESGDAERMAELFVNFGSAMLIGIMCIYIVLVLLFHDFFQPFTILAALPLSLGGAFIALLITNNSFSMPSVIGILMLMGIVTKNSILLVEYAIRAQHEYGLIRTEALIDSCRKRSQPIMMTTIAMVAGMIPIALGLGAEPSFRAPMAVVVIGGLLTSTFLSLVVIPVIFTYIDDVQLGLQWIVNTFYFNSHNAINNELPLPILNVERLEVITENEGKPDISLS
jgi:multidrug efflux pump subunit AcrB